MRETINDWKTEWIETNGMTDEFEVVIKDSKLDDFSSFLYEGSFVNIPVNMLNSKVVEASKIIDSSIPERIGAYALKIKWEGK